MTYFLHIGEEMRRVGVKRGQGTKGKETQNLASVSEENERTSLLLREYLACSNRICGI